ncbi:MAG: cellulase family glycosylhydrolase, partial [Opitutales bacterium]
MKISRFRTFAFSAAIASIGLMAACQTTESGSGAPAQEDISAEDIRALTQAMEGLGVTVQVSYFLDLAPAANMGFADEVEGDKKGGWTDQGPAKDLSGFKPGPFSFSDVSFKIVDPAANGGRSIIMLAGGDRQYFPQSATVQAKNGANGKYLYLLHSSGWMPPKGTTIGTMDVLFADGSTQRIEVKAGVDVNDWWNPLDLENGFVAWTKQVRDVSAGLYVSQFEIQGKPIESVTFTSERKAVWAVVAATVSNTKAELPAPHELVTTAGADWRPIAASLSVEPGSALDLSGMLDGPAGKYGFVEAREGHFRFENAPDKRVRFYGTNLCYSANFPTHEEAGRIAADLAATGYNVVRFHHYDDMLTQDSPDSMTPDPQMQDRMEYMIAQCEKRGMYIVIDLFSFRQIRKGEIPEIDEPMRAGFKALPPVLDSAFVNWKTFARNMLTHVNPYTGRSLAEDPALVGICPVNEDPLGTAWHESPAIAKIYDGLFAQWKADNGVDPKGQDEETAAISRFLNGIQLRADRMYEGFLRDELHVRAPLTGTNCLTAISLAETRANYDYVDNHLYWDHPQFPQQSW